MYANNIVALCYSISLTQFFSSWPLHTYYFYSYAAIFFTLHLDIKASLIVAYFFMLALLIGIYVYKSLPSSIMIMYCCLIREALRSATHYNTRAWQT